MTSSHVPAAAVADPLPPATAIATDVVPPTPAVLADADAAAGRWSVGTLTYTVGGLVTLFALLLGGDFALQMRERSVPPIAQVILTRHFHVSDSLQAFLLLELPPALALLIAPAVSFKSDRLRTAWGRRIPFLLVSTPVAAGAMVALAFTEPIGEAVARLVGVGPRGPSLVMFGLSWTAFECAAIVAAAVLGGLINDVVPRPLLGRFFGLFRAVSLIAGMIFYHWSMAKAADHYRAILVGIAVLFGGGFTLMCLFVREGTYPPPPPVEAGAMGLARRWATVGDYFRVSFRDGYYRWVFAAMALAGAALLPVNAFSIPYAHQIGLSDGDYGQRLVLTYGVSLALAWPLGWLVDRVTSLWLATATMAAYTAAMGAAAVGVAGPRSFGVAFVVHGVLSGCYFTAAASLGQSLFPRLRYGQFASAAGIVTSLAAIAVSGGTGWVLDHTDHHYRLTFHAAAVLGVAATASLLVVCRSRRPADGESVPAFA